MTKFTKEFIAEQRKSLIERENFYGWDNCISLEALDEIERLQAEKDKLIAENKELKNAIKKHIIEYYIGSPRED